MPVAREWQAALGLQDCMVVVGGRADIPDFEPIPLSCDTMSAAVEILWYRLPPTPLAPTGSLFLVPAHSQRPWHHTREATCFTTASFILHVQQQHRRTFRDGVCIQNDSSMCGCRVPRRYPGECGCEGRGFGIVILPQRLVVGCFLLGPCSA
jgi:hypothetical protein